MYRTSALLYFRYRRIRLLTEDLSDVWECYHVRWTTPADVESIPRRAYQTLSLLLEILSDTLQVATIGPSRYLLWLCDLVSTSGRTPKTHQRAPIRLVMASRVRWQPILHWSLNAGQLSTANEL